MNLSPLFIYFNFLSLIFRPIAPLSCSSLRGVRERGGGTKDPGERSNLVATLAEKHVFTAGEIAPGTTLQGIEPSSHSKIKTFLTLRQEIANVRQCIWKYPYKKQLLINNKKVSCNIYCVDYFIT